MNKREQRAHTLKYVALAKIGRAACQSTTRAWAGPLRAPGRRARPGQRNDSKPNLAARSPRSGARQAPACSAQVRAAFNFHALITRFGGLLYPFRDNTTNA